MIEIQEVHEVKYNIKLDAEKLAPAVYFEMLRVFDCLTKIKTEEDLKNIKYYYHIQIYHMVVISKVFKIILLKHIQMVKQLQDLHHYHHLKLQRQFLQFVNHIIELKN